MITLEDAKQDSLWDHIKVSRDEDGGISISAPLTFHTKIRAGATENVPPPYNTIHNTFEKRMASEAVDIAWIMQHKLNEFLLHEKVEDYELRTSFTNIG